MKRLLTLFAAVVVSVAAAADEGMWLPSMIENIIGDMQAKGFRLEAEDVYSVNRASLKDAVVLFGSGCTGELISDKGLLITNHHCGYYFISSHSTVEHDYLRDGFWALNMEEELPCPGLTVSFLEWMRDVTDEVLAGYREGMSEDEREEIVARNSAALIEAATGGNEDLKAKVAPLYYGNQYFLYLFKIYRDVRLVGAPPSSIGKFGGDTDNWMWPRHTGDFSMFRIYANPTTNEPADYDPANVPLKPRKFFEISTAGVKEGDFTFVYGCPGSTREYVTGSAVSYIADRSNPHKVALRTIRNDAQKRAMAQSQALRIMYSHRNANVTNAWKKWRGEAKGLKRMQVVARKKAFEAEFREWARGGEYEGMVERLDALQEELDNYMFAQEYYKEAIVPLEYPAYVLGGCKDSVSFRANYYKPIDEECFTALLTLYGENVPPEFRPDYYDQKLAQFGGVKEWGDAVLSCKEEALEFARTFAEYNSERLAPVIDSLGKEINTLMRDYMRGQMEFQPDKKFYPDANLTLRIAYGKVAGCRPCDGVAYLPVSTIEGIMEKDNPEIFDYNIPQKLRDLYRDRDFGRWESDGSVPVCFLATNHTTGGNSGSPVINADGRLIGINFDRAWDGVMSDLYYNPEICRNISLDIRYALFIIDKLANASNILEELVLVP